MTEHLALPCPKPRAASCGGLRRAQRLSWCALAAGVVAACQETLPEAKPVPPDMSALEASYRVPTLTLDQQTMPLLAESLGPTMGQVEAAEALVPAIRAAVQETAKEAENQSSSHRQGPGLQPQALTGEGFARVDRICPGWEGAGPDAANGYLHLLLGFTEKGIDPVVWGSADACKVGVEGKGVTLSGTINISLGLQSVMPDALQATPMLLQVQLQVTAADNAESLETDFRADPSGGVEFRVFVDEQVAIYWDDSEQRGYRAANGRFTCDFDHQQCTGESGSTLFW